MKSLLIIFLLCSHWVTAQDTLLWWENNGSIKRSQLFENKPFLLSRESGSARSASIFSFSCQYQEPNSEKKSFSICDSTFNHDTEVNVWVEGEYEQFSGNKFPDCLLPFLESLPVGTILYFDHFISICPDCVARRRSFKFHFTLIE
jgi:hypothetical protein